MTLRSPDDFKRIQSSGAVSQEDQQLLVFSADSEDLADNLVEEKDLSQLSDELMKQDFMTPASSKNVVTFSGLGNLRNTKMPKNKTLADFNSRRKSGILRSKLNKQRTMIIHRDESRLIGDQMTELFKDDHLYETGLIDNPNYKLHSLRDFSALNFQTLANEMPPEEEEEKEEQNKYSDNYGVFKATRRDSLYDWNSNIKTYSLSRQHKMIWDKKIVQRNLSL